MTTQTSDHRCVFAGTVASDTDDGRDPQGLVGVMQVGQVPDGALARNTDAVHHAGGDLRQTMGEIPSARFAEHGLRDGGAQLFRGNEASELRSEAAGCRHHRVGEAKGADHHREVDVLCRVGTLLVEGCARIHAVGGRGQGGGQSKRLTIRFSMSVTTAYRR